MGDENAIRTLRDYSKPSHEGYRNTIELPVGNNVVPLRFDIIRLVQNGCSFYGLRSEDPNQHPNDFLKHVDSLDLDGENRERTRLQSLSEAWTRFKDLLQKVHHHGISRWFQIQIFYDHVSFHLKCEIDRIAGGKLRDKNADESWKIIENLSLYDHEGWNDTKEFIKLVKAISTPQSTSKTHDRILFELKNQINFLLKGSRPTPRPSSAHNPQAYAQAVYSNPRSQNQNEPPKLNPFTFHKRTAPNPQPQALGTTFEKGPRKVLIREEAKSPVTKSVNSISLIREKEEKSDKYNVTTGDDSEKTNGPITEVSVKEAETKYKAENRVKNKPIKKPNKAEVGEAPSSQLVEYYLKHRINEKLIEGLVDNNRFNVRSSIRNKKWIPESLCKIERGIKNDIEPIAPTMTIKRLILEWDERIKLHLDRKMEFDQWRSKNFKGKHPALVNVEGELDDEGEVTKFLIKNEEEIFTDAGDGVRIIPDGVASPAITWMVFGENTRDLCSFGEETDKITDLHQIHKVLLTERGDDVASIKRRRRDPSSDGVWNLETISGRGRLKEDLESST
ncbi:hypothetical protein Tco_1105646 [Tanacetum coccineum]